jgi:hypothetical protein
MKKTIGLRHFYGRFLKVKTPLKRGGGKSLRGRNYSVKTFYGRFVK